MDRHSPRHGIKFRVPRFPIRITEDYPKKKALQRKVKQFDKMRYYHRSRTRINPQLFEFTLRRTAKIGRRSNTNHGTERKRGRTDILSHNETDIEINDRT